MLFHGPAVAACTVILDTPGQQVLLVRRGRAPYKYWWDIPGGFVDYTESPEHAAIREAAEETGLTVRLTRLLGVWPGTYQRREGLDRTLCFYYLAEPVAGEPRAGDDADALAWFPLTQPPTRLAWPETQRAVLERAAQLGD
jgi:8-oxo-dGTP diphosphatase